MSGSSPDHEQDFSGLRFDRPAEHVLRITLDGPGLNAVGPDVHRELADVWLAVDRDPDTRVAVLQGAFGVSTPVLFIGLGVAMVIRLRIRLRRTLREEEGITIAPLWLSIARAWRRRGAAGSSTGTGVRE